MRTQSMRACFSNMTKCKIRVNLGCTEPRKGEITVLHRELRNQKTIKSGAEKINFFENAKFASGLAYGHLLFEKKGFIAHHFFSAIFTAFFVF